jgi:hypothetical protein
MPKSRRKRKCEETEKRFSSKRLTPVEVPVWNHRDRRGVWKALDVALLAEAGWKTSLKLLVFGYAIGGDEASKCVVCVDHWRSAAKLCNECGASTIWQQRSTLWSAYSQRVTTNAKSWVWPEVAQLSDLDVRCAAMQAFLLKKNCFLNAQACIDIYRRLTRGLPNMFDQIAAAEQSKFKNIIQAVICCFHNESACESVGIYGIIEKDRQVYGPFDASVTTSDDPAVQLHKAIEVASRMTPRRIHLDPHDFLFFLNQGPKSLPREQL